MSYNTELVAELNRVGQPGTRERNDQLLPRVVAGDLDAYQEMICSNVALACYRADFFVQSQHRQGFSIEFLRDDLISAGIYGVVEAVNRIRNGAQVTNPTAMIGYWIRKEIMLAAVKEPHEYQETSVTYREPDTEGWSEDEDLTDCRKQGTESTSQIDPSFQLVDLRDLIYSCCETEQEHILIRLRETEGMDCTEIAPLLHVSKNTIYRMLRVIEERFNRKNRP